MGTTPIFAIPYVEPTNTLATFPVADKAQAEAVEAAIDQAPHWCELNANTQQSIPHNAETLVNLNGGSQEPSGQWTSGSSVKILRSGLYQVVLGFSFLANTTGSRVVQYRANGVNVKGWRVPTSTAGDCTGTVSTLRRFSVNDIVALVYFQSSGIALNTSVQSYPSLGLVRLGA